jgi:PRC-barrel domain
MATTTQAKPLSRRETSSLIGTDKVEGTPVYRSNGDRVGQIERIMVDKFSGKVAYAVMSFGGFKYGSLPTAMVHPHLQSYAWRL